MCKSSLGERGVSPDALKVKEVAEAIRAHAPPLAFVTGLANRTAPRFLVLQLPGIAGRSPLPGSPFSHNFDGEFGPVSTSSAEPDCGTARPTTITSFRLSDESRHD